MPARYLDVRLGNLHFALHRIAMMETELREDLDSKVRRLPELVNKDAWLVHRGRFLNLDFVIQIDNATYYISVEGGVVAVSADKRLTPAYAFALRGKATTWQAFWENMPRPPFHDIFAMSHRADLRIEGDLRPLMANLTYFKDVLSAVRGGSART